MLIVITLMISGIILGYILREKKLKSIQMLITCAIFTLLFLLGISVGANETIMDHLDTIGWDAFVITLGAVGGSIVCAWIVYRFFFK